MLRKNGNCRSGARRDMGVQCRSGMLRWQQMVERYAGRFFGYRVSEREGTGILAAAKPGSLGAKGIGTRPGAFANWQASSQGEGRQADVVSARSTENFPKCDCTPILCRKYPRAWVGQARCDSSCRKPAAMQKCRFENWRFPLI